MSPTSPPESYTTFTLPCLRFAHHPSNAPAATPIVIVSLHRPEAKNAFTTEMAASLVTAFGTLSRDPRVKCVVLTSSDPANRTFCAGMDLSAPRGRGSSGSSSSSSASAMEAKALDHLGFGDTPVDQARAEYRDSGGVVSMAIWECKKPVVMAMNGNAVGVGITMTLPANVRVVSEDAVVGFVFARRGLVMEACSSFFLPRLIGTSKAVHICTTGAVYKPVDPLVRDLFSDVVAKDRVLPRALEIASEIATHTSAVSTRVMKDMIYRGGQTVEEAHSVESKVLFDLFRGRDFTEGVMSFKQRREPKFEGTLEEDAPKVWPWWEWKGVAMKPNL